MITVYSKPNCVQCTFTKKHLEEHGIKYEEIDVTQDEQALAELEFHKFKSVPVVRVGTFDNAWAGFRPDRLDELVNHGEY
ncbi:glutaredoxin family protein [Aerococcaceae bacterium WGS1372]